MDNQLNKSGLWRTAAAADPSLGCLFGLFEGHLNGSIEGLGPFRKSFQKSPPRTLVNRPTPLHDSLAPHKPGELSCLIS